MYKQDEELLGMRYYGIDVQYVAGRFLAKTHVSESKLSVQVVHLYSKPVD